jgi:hypothetical protein
MLKGKRGGKWKGVDMQILLKSGLATLIMMMSGHCGDGGQNPIRFDLSAGEKICMDPPAHQSTFTLDPKNDEIAVVIDGHSGEIVILNKHNNTIATRGGTYSLLDGSGTLVLTVNDVDTATKVFKFFEIAPTNERKLYMLRAAIDAFANKSYESLFIEHFCKSYGDRVFFQKIIGTHLSRSGLKGCVVDVCACTGTSPVLGFRGVRSQLVHPDIATQFRMVINEFNGGKVQLAVQGSSSEEVAGKFPEQVAEECSEEEEEEY